MRGIFSIPHIFACQDRFVPQRVLSYSRVHDQSSMCNYIDTSTSCGMPNELLPFSDTRFLLFESLSSSQDTCAPALTCTVVPLLPNSALDKAFRLIRPPIIFVQCQCQQQGVLCGLTKFHGAAILIKIVPLLQEGVLGFRV
jgi:hypothetical protein